MKRIVHLLVSGFICGVCLNAAELSPMGAVFDQQISSIEKEIVSLAEAMPADKYDFAPTQGAFKGVRTFAAQAKHVAAVVYSCSAAVLQEKAPADVGKSEDGPATAKSKEEIVKYLQDSFRYAHKAASSLTPANIMDMVPSAFGSNKVSRMYMASVPVWHSFDHYGQMVVYARMNGVVPPASK